MSSGAVLEPIPIAAFSLILAAAQRLSVADWLAGGDRDDAGLCFTAQRRSGRLSTSR